MPSHPNQNGRAKLAAYAVALATAVGGTSSSAEGAPAIEKLERYCTASWRNAGIARQDWEDCTQQALTELLERASHRQLAEAIENAESEERRELNRSVWRTTQRWRRSARWYSLEEGSLAAASENERVGEAWDQVVEAGRSCLSRRQQQILSLTRDGWRVSEIAARLSLSAARVSDEKYKAIAKLREHLSVA
jgi:DNA-directed RNA polymerase specialized sigma subunit